nr:MAG TPA: hypothetical protein [Caudoviricetes sp.]
MADTIEKVYCTGDGGSNDLATALIARGNNNDPMALMAAMGGGMGNWMNNPFAYMMMMAWMRDWNNRGGNLQDTELQNQIASLRTQMQDGNNTALLMDAVKGNGVALGQLAQNLNCDMNQLQNAVCGVQAAIQDVGGRVGFSAERVINAANLGDLNIVQQLKDCCCQTQQNIIRMGYENQLGQKDILNAMQQGFSYTNTGIERAASNIGNLLQAIACDIKTSGKDNTQRIVDVLNNHWQEDLLRRLNRAELQISQERQNATLIAALKPTTTTAG